MSKMILLSFASVSFAGVFAQAQSMPFAPRMSCEQAQNLFSAQGAVVLRTSDTTYDRYVSDFSFCSNAGDETLRPAFIVTKNDPQCFVGYTCSQDNRGNGGGN